MTDANQPTIVYVHGIGNKPPADALRAAWDQALFGRDAGADSRMAYWAPLLHPQPDATWGLHLVDGNIALGNLIRLVRHQAEHYRAARR